MKPIIENTLPRPRIFFDSSALISGVISPTGAARAIMMLAESSQVTIVISEQVLVETERTLARKAVHALPYYRGSLRHAGSEIVRDPSSVQLRLHDRIISDLSDVPIVVAAMMAGVGFLVTLNRRHFIDDPSVAARSGLRIGSPGDGLAWLRDRLAEEAD